jgi:hypothetical protein
VCVKHVFSRIFDIRHSIRIRLDFSNTNDMSIRLDSYRIQGPFDSTIIRSDFHPIRLYSIRLSSDSTLFDPTFIRCDFIRSDFHPIRLHSIRLLFDSTFIRSDFYSTRLPSDSTFIRLDLHSIRLLFDSTSIRSDFYSTRLPFDPTFIRLDFYSIRLLFDSTFIRLDFYSIRLLFDSTFIRFVFYSRFILRIIFIFILFVLILSNIFGCVVEFHPGNISPVWCC